MTAMARLALAILVLAVAVGGGAAANGALCNYTITVKTADEIFAGTDSFIDLGLFFRKKGVFYGWMERRDGAGGARFEQGSTDSWNITDFACMAPCRVYLRVVKKKKQLSDVVGSAWKCDLVGVEVYQKEVRKVSRSFVLGKWVQDGTPVDTNHCNLYDQDLITLS